MSKAGETLTANDGFEGLRTFEGYENEINLVITDLLMPGLSGVGLISILKKKYPGIPIIAITGWRGDIEATGQKLDADLVFEKPFEISELDKSVPKILTNKGASSPPR